MRRRFGLVFKARAGVAVPRLLDGVLKALRKDGAEVFQLPTRSAEEASHQVAQAARDANCDAVIAAGGDGTFRAVAAGAAGSALPIGLIPLGTGNVLAHELGLRRRPAEIAHGLISDPVIDAHGGQVNGQPFFLMVGAGFDAHIVNGLDYRTKRLIGRGAYTAPVLRTLGRGPEQFDVEIDGRSFEASWVILTLASHYGGSFTLTRETQVGHRQMIAVLIEARSRTQLLGTALSLALGRLHREGTRPGHVRVLPCQRALIGRRRTAPIEIDGDEGGLSPVDVLADGPRVRIIAPARYVADVTNRHANRVR